MSLSYYIAYEKKTNAMKEKNRPRYTKYYNLNFTENKINDLISVNS